MGASRNRARGRLGSTRAAGLLLAGLSLVLLGGSFGLGVLTGRQWAERTALAPPSSRQENGKPEAATAGGRGESASGRRGRGVASEPEYPQIQEKLTFYQTLPAPLGAEKEPPDRPAKKEARAEKAGAPPSDAGAASPGPPAYTVQVAAYRSRAQAEALRRALGESAYVVEATAESGVTYRVRVGAYSTRAEAEAVAARVRAERAMATFITTR
jgi:DedD protein